MELHQNCCFQPWSCQSGLYFGVLQSISVEWIIPQGRSPNFQPISPWVPGLQHCWGNILLLQSQVKQTFGHHLVFPIACHVFLSSCKTFSKKAYSPRILHHPKLYARFHKKHHEWTAPIGITSIYCTPLEMVISNLFPIALGPFLMQSHLFVTWIWWVLVIIKL